MASMASRDSPINARRRSSSRTLRPASIRIRALDVARNAALPELPLARTQNRTVTNLPRSVLAASGGGKQWLISGKSGQAGQRKPPCRRSRPLFRHFLFDHLDQLLTRSGALLQGRRLFGGEFDF